MVIGLVTLCYQFILSTNMGQIGAIHSQIITKPVTSPSKLREERERTATRRGCRFSTWKVCLTDGGRARPRKGQSLLLNCSSSNSLSLSGLRSSLILPWASSFKHCKRAFRYTSISPTSVRWSEQARYTCIVLSKAAKGGFPNSNVLHVLNVI